MTDDFYFLSRVARTLVALRVVKLAAQVDATLGMNCNNSGNLPPSGQNFNLSMTLLYD